MCIEKYYFIYLFFLIQFLFSCQAEWETVFLEASLTLVTVKKSFYGSVLFLCRCQSEVKQPIFLPVDGTDYKWVETLKVSFRIFFVRLCMYFKNSCMCPDIQFFKIRQTGKMERKTVIA